MSKSLPRDNREQGMRQRGQHMQQQEGLSRVCSLCGMMSLQVGKGVVGRVLERWSGPHRALGTSEEGGCDQSLSLFSKVTGARGI